MDRSDSSSFLAAPTENKTKQQIVKASCDILLPPTLLPHDKSPSRVPQCSASKPITHALFFFFFKQLDHYCSRTPCPEDVPSTHLACMSRDCYRRFQPLDPCRREEVAGSQSHTIHSSENQQSHWPRNTLIDFHFPFWLVPPHSIPFHSLCKDEKYLVVRTKHVKQTAPCLAWPGVLAI
jgi:hypothetical protein